MDKNEDYYHNGFGYVQFSIKYYYLQFFYYLILYILYDINLTQGLNIVRKY